MRIYAFFKDLFAGFYEDELLELDRWRVNWGHYRRWLAEFRLISCVLDNLWLETVSRRYTPKDHITDKHALVDIRILRELVRKESTRAEVRQYSLWSLPELTVELSKIQAAIHNKIADPRTSIVWPPQDTSKPVPKEET